MINKRRIDLVVYEEKSRGLFKNVGISTMFCIWRAIADLYCENPENQHGRVKEYRSIIKNMLISQLSTIIGDLSN